MQLSCLRLLSEHSIRSIHRALQVLIYAWKMAADFINEKTVKVSGFQSSCRFDSTNSVWHLFIMCGRTLESVLSFAVSLAMSAPSIGRFCSLHCEVQKDFKTAGWSKTRLVAFLGQRPDQGIQQAGKAIGVPRFLVWDKLNDVSFRISAHSWSIFGWSDENILGWLNNGGQRSIISAEDKPVPPMLLVVFSDTKNHSNCVFFNSLIPALHFLECPWNVGDGKSASLDFKLDHCPYLPWWNICRKMYYLVKVEINQSFGGG